MAGVVIALAGVPAGCAAFPTALSSPAASRTPTPLHSPTPDPAPTKPALAELVVGIDGLGPIHFGAQVPAAAAETAVTVYQDDYCLANGAVGQPGVGMWVPNYPPSGSAQGGLAPFTVLTAGGVESGGVSGIWVWSPEISTATGVHVGSTVAELTAAYPDFDHISPTVVTTAYTIDRAPARLMFEVATNTEFWGAEKIGSVQAIEVLAGTAGLVSAFEGDGPGGCGD